MFKTNTLLEYLSSPIEINKIILGIIWLGALNVIFITYCVRNTYGAVTIERENLKIQKAKIDKLFPKKP